MSRPRSLVLVVAWLAVAASSPGSAADPARPPAHPPAPPAVAGPAAAASDAALAGMVETERAFAALALELGTRAAFLAYIAEDGIGFDNGPIPLRQAMRDRPAGPEPFKLIWEPRYGDVAASGEVGYLTGPYRVETQGKDGTRVTRHGCFFSVWRRQSDGACKIAVDTYWPTH